mmetsp:Transcript_109313/g.189450  ORF Transcript_109313/g.189450 Transcript_109313/m.189450 type:complete len:96 (+) Transcript_109313:877-1164(+)
MAKVDWQGWIGASIRAGTGCMQSFAAYDPGKSEEGGLALGQGVVGAAGEACVMKPFAFVYLSTGPPPPISLSASLALPSRVCASTGSLADSLAPI